MGWFDSFTQNDDYQQSPHASVYEEKQHQSSWTHELVGGAAGFEAMRLYEQHEAANGKAPSHQIAKEVLAGIAAAEVGMMSWRLPCWDILMHWCPIYVMGF